MTRRRSPSEVSSSRIDQAAARPHPTLVGARLDDNAILSDPKGQTEKQRQEEMKRHAADKHDAARWVARMTMLRSHGCTGRLCACGAHPADREVRDDLLAMLGLGEAS